MTSAPFGTLPSGLGTRSRNTWLLADSGPQHAAARTERVESRTGRLPGPGACGTQSVPPVLLDLSSDEGRTLLAPFLGCTSPADFVAFQEPVDMPRLVERLDDWSAVRLSALGPVRPDALPALTLKRAAFILRATERYGFVYAEVPILFLLHSAHDDELRELLRLLAGDKQLAQTLGPMPAVRAELAHRGLPLSDYPERPERGSDVLRGLGRAAREALDSSALSDQVRGMEFGALRAQLPPPYQRALAAVDDARLRQHVSFDHMALGVFDMLTFGVPVGFYSLVKGTGHGMYSLTQGQYEQGTRELAPAALLVAVFAAGKVGTALSEAGGVVGEGSGAAALEMRLQGLRDMARQLEGQLGVEGLRELAREIQASQEAGRFVAVGGVDAALALHEARGDVARAQAWLSQRKPESPGLTGQGDSTRGLAGRTAAGAEEAARGTLERTLEGLGAVESLVDPALGLTGEVVEAKLAQTEWADEGPRLSTDVTVLERARPSLEAPPPGIEGHPRWSEYVAYWEKRLGELREGRAEKGPLRWEAYERMWGGFSRGLAFERVMVQLLRADAALPRAQRRFLGDFDLPRVESYVGVWKPKVGLRFADVLVIEQQPPPPGQLPRVETFSFKSRHLAGLERKAVQAQMKADAREALDYYGETVNIRRPSLKLLFREESKVSVSKVRLVYEGGNLKPRTPEAVRELLDWAEDNISRVGISFQ